MNAAPTPTPTPESEPQTLIDEVLVGGERGTACEHEMEDRRAWHFTVALMLRMAMKDAHGVPMPDQVSRERVRQTTQNGEAWKNLY